MCNGFFNGPIKIPISDSLDLHTFNPRDVGSLLEEYLSECQRLGYKEVKIIHGKGKGTLRNLVHGFLKSSPKVAGFCLATAESGSWGATIVKLRKRAGRSMPGQM